MVIRTSLPIDILIQESQAGGSPALSEFRRLTVDLPPAAATAGGSSESDGAHRRRGAERIRVRHGNREDALSIELNRTVRVPDRSSDGGSGSGSALPPGLGRFPLFRVRDHDARMPADMAAKGGVFFPMYQREAMWIAFRSTSAAPFALRVHVGGVNAVSGVPMREEEEGGRRREERLRALAGERRTGRRKGVGKGDAGAGPSSAVQDYMVVPGQRWLDGIVSEDGRIRQFVAKPKGSGFSVEAQVTGEETVGGIQIEVIPIKKVMPEKMDVRYEDRNRNVVKRTLQLAEKGITDQSRWADLKALLKEEFNVPLEKQRLLAGPYVHISDEDKLGDSYFEPNFTLGLQHVPDIKRYDQVDTRSRLVSPAKKVYSAMPPPPGAAAPLASPTVSKSRALRKSADARHGAPLEPSQRAERAEVKEMGLAAGGLIQQTIEPDTYAADAWDVEASILFNIQILDSESFAAVTGLPPPPTPVDAKTYQQQGYPFFEIWGEEKTGIQGDFGQVKSIAQIEKERAEAEGKEYEEEEDVPQRVWVIGNFRSTFKPVEILRRELEALSM